MYTGLLLQEYFQASKHDAAQNETWLGALALSHMTFWVGLGQKNLPTASGYARLLYFWFGEIYVKYTNCIYENVP